MNFLNAFIITGLFCLVAEVIMEYTHLTPGHITSLFTILGSFLSLIDIYPKLLDFSLGGSSILICNFGHLLYKGSIEGYFNYGFIGIFKEMFAYSSLALSSAIIISFICTLFFKPKN